MLRLLTSGESHGIGLTAILEGLPANLEVSAEDINRELSRRQEGYGRGARQLIEKDQATILSGVRHGLTLGTPLTLFVENNDHKNWREAMSPAPVNERVADVVTKIRPGHADYPGLIKYNQKDIRNILERASARTTAAQVAAGAICKKLLAEFKITIESLIVSVAEVSVNATELNEAAKQRIDQAKEAGDSLGGIIQLTVKNPPIGLGSHVQHDRKLDGLLAATLMALQSVKGVEFGLGFETARLPGSAVHDELFVDRGTIYRNTNHAGGIEGGMTNGEDIVIRLALKPIPTMVKPLKTVDWTKKKPADAHYERSDVCVVESAAVVAEALVAIEIARVFLEKFGGDSLEEVRRHFNS